MVVVLACVPVAACGGVATHAEVQGRIAEFLVAIRDRADALGWDQLRDDVRASYPGRRAAWIQAMGAGDTSELTWRIDDVSVDDYVGCARVDFGESRHGVPTTLFDDNLPALARVASPLDKGAFYVCATVGPLPFDTGVHGVG